MDKKLVGSRICVKCEHNALVCDCGDSGSYLLFEEYIENKYHKYHHDRPDECYQKYLKYREI